jgi:hypothetical protein
MRIRNLAVAITLTCAVLGAALAPFAWQAFMNSFSHAWDPSYEPTGLAAFTFLPGVAGLLVMPLGLPIGEIIGNQTIGFAIGGAIEGAVAGAALSFFVAMFAGRLTPNSTSS